MPDPLNVFISYARQDGREYAARLDTDLRAAGFRTWRDTRDIDPNQDFSAELEEAISNSTHVVCCITPDTVRKDSFVRREIGYALAVKKPIIPLVFERTLPPIQIINVTRINANTGQWVQTISEVVTRLNHPDDQTAEQATPPDDPYRDYLNTLYEQIVHYLNRTVFSLVTLRSEATPEAVKSPSRQVLPMAFFDMAGIEAKEEERWQFSNFNEAFEHYGRRVLLLGEPGAGKTTTLFAFARDAVAARLADPMRPLPIIAPIATWDSEKQTPLANWLASQLSILKQEDIERLIANGLALLMLDGLDELGEEEENLATKEKHDPRLRFMKQIESLSKSDIVVSCRNKDYADIGAKLALSGSVTLQPLNDEQMREYLHEMPDLWAVLEADDELRDVARTPLLLSLFTFAFRDLPEEAKALRSLKGGDVRDKIFETYVRRRYEHEERKLNNVSSFTLRELNDILGYVAMQNVVRREEIKNLIPTSSFAEAIYWDRINEFLYFAIDLQLLIPGEMPKSFEFTHLLLRDHFAFVYSMQCIKYGDNKMRGRAATTLSELNDLRALEPLIDALDDDNINVRIRSASALGTLRHPHAVKPLIKLLSDSSLLVNTNVVAALINIGTPEALAAVEEWRRAQGNER